MRLQRRSLLEAAIPLSKFNVSSHYLPRPSVIIRRLVNATVAVVTSETADYGGTNFDDEEEDELDGDVDIEAMLLAA